MRSVVRVLLVVCALVGRVDAAPQDPLDANALDRIAAAFDRDDFEAAEHALKELPAPSARIPLSGIELRHAALTLRAALLRGRFDEAAALDVVLADAPADADFMDELAFARAEYHRLRPRIDDVDEARALATADALYGAALRGATPARRAARTAAT